MLFAATTAPLALAWASPALAQAAPPAPSAQTAATDQSEIIVTARKRQESILRVPVVESVLSAETLERSQVTDIHDVVTKVPGLHVGNNVLTVGTQIALRGVGTSSLDAGVDQSVSLNIDGLQFSQGATYNVGLFDMAQVEVLKGPQSLFYGKSSPGGVVSIRTADPTDKFEVIMRGSYEFYARERRAELILSGPVSDTLRLRFSLMGSDDDGYFRNKAFAQTVPYTGAVTPSGRYNDTNQYIMRGTVLFQPSSKFRARLKINHAEQKIIGGGSPLGSCPDGIATPPLPGFLPAGIQFINPNETCKVDRNVYIVNVDPAVFPGARNNGVPFMKSRTNFGTLELNYDFANDISLNSTTGYFKTIIDGMINGVNTGYAGPTLIADNHFNRHDFTEEVRLQSNFRGKKPYDFLLGGYYQNAEVSNRIWVGGNTRMFLPATLTAGINDVSIKTWAIFGQGIFRPSSVLEIALGARYTDEKRHDDTFKLLGIDGPSVPAPILKPTLRSKNWSPELTITYTPTEDLTIFGALKQGYKSGSYVMTFPPPAAPPAGCAAAPGQTLCDNSFGDERVRGAELGLKSRLLDRSLSVNLAGYYYKYKGLQVGTNEIAQGGLPVGRTINAGSAKVYGIDFDLTYRPHSVPGLTGNLGINWNHARFGAFTNAQCIGGQTIAEGCNQDFNAASNTFIHQDLSSARLPKAADWQMNAGIDYELPVGGGLRMLLGADAQYSSKFLRLLGQHRSDFFQPGYVKLNANVALRSKNDAWEVALIGNNLTNKYIAGNCTNFSGATGQIFSSPLTGAAGRNASGVDELACIPEKGREVFLRITLRPSAM